MKPYFNLLGIEIHYYSLCILLGIVCAYLIIMKEAKKNNYKEETISDLIFYGIIFGLLGDRIHYVLFNLDYYLLYKEEILKVWHGGLAIHGGIIFGVIFVYLFTKKHKLNFIKLLDIISPGLILAQSIGRWGNFFNQEAYGSSVSYSFLRKLLIPKFIINNMKIDGIYYLPTFYFESILCLIGFIIMLFLRRRKNNKIGEITGFYMIWYSIGRTFIEYMRQDSLMLGPVKVAQLISGIFIIMGMVIIINSKKQPKNDNLYNVDGENEKRF